MTFSHVSSINNVCKEAVSFEDRMWDLIVSVPDHCLSFYFFCLSCFYFSAVLIVDVPFPFGV